VFSSLPDERALVLGLAQTFGATFNAWVPLVMFNTGTQAPYFKTGYLVVTIMSAAQAVGVVAMWYLGQRIVRQIQEAKNARTDTDSPTREIEETGRKELSV
jgi:ACS family pantothenate transporter-like MFS transporter